MILNIYILTVLASLGVNTSLIIASYIKARKVGYRMNNETKRSLQQHTIMENIATIGLAGITFLGLSIVGNAIPVANIYFAGRDLLNWKKTIYETIDRWEEAGSITQNPIAISPFIKSLNEKTLMVRKESGQSSKEMIESLIFEGKENDQTATEMIESLFFEGATKKEIKQELKASKGDRQEVANKGLQQKVDNFANDMITEIMLNSDLTLEQRQELLKKFRKVAINERHVTMSPIYEALNIAAVGNGPKKDEEKQLTL